MVYDRASSRGWKHVTNGWWSRLLHARNTNSPSQSRENIHRHYDLGNDFYQLWLDERMLYTCAYFDEPEYSLEQAQLAKMEHVCRKLWLRPGETVIDAGCGWGAFALYMARKYGVQVKAFNISANQIEYAREQARREGLDRRVEFILDDWRCILGSCDVFVSLGMLEHVGRDNYRRLSDVIDRCLGSSGRGLIHTIGQNRPWPVTPWVERRIFPGAYPPSLRQALEILEPHEFSVLDVENLRLHYAETARHWLRRFEQSTSKVRTMFGDQFVRLWTLYLAGSVAVFQSGNLQLFQILFARGKSNDIPRTRRHVYAEPLNSIEPANATPGATA
jgi:cyclopropane-fatty-acyl-phospholipid synthase